MVDLAPALLKLAGPQIGNAMGQISSYLASLNAHLSGVSENTAAIAERLAAIDAGQVRLAAQIDGLRTVIAEMGTEQRALARFILQKEYSDGHVGLIEPTADVDVGNVVSLTG